MIQNTRRVAIVLVLPWALSAPAADVPRPEHPTPDAVRAHWANLNGAWQFRFDPRDEGLKAGWEKAGPEAYDRTITVPFGWESELSGIREPGATGVAWYRRTFRVPDDFPKGESVWLRFGAVDYRADVWVNGKHVAEHEGGYTPFEADVTDALAPGEPASLVVRAFDATDREVPNGKQLGGYTKTSGIWQTVWLESRPAAHIARFTATTRVEPGDVGVSYRVHLEGLRPGKPHVLRVRGEGSTASVAFTPESDTYDAEPGGPHWTRARLWTPEDPYLHDATLELEGPDGRVDAVRTYFGLRTIARGRYGDEPYGRILLNGKPIYLRTALDQSFNPKGVYTAPSDEFMRRDLELARSLGLNGLRIHIKPDEPRRLYWADRLGLLVLEDMPNTMDQSPRARRTWEATMREVVARDRNHPAIIAWIDFNETWGLGDAAKYKHDRDATGWVRRMVAETRRLDPTRLVEDNSACNGDHVEGTDLNSWHFYIDDHEAARAHIAEVVARTEPGSPFNYCPGMAQADAPLINSEYGAVGGFDGDRDVSWGFRDLTTQLRRHAKIQGYVYTELTDIEWEHNGFLDYDRGPKEFGYEAFVPGMTPADLQGADFIGHDAPPAIVAAPGEVIEIPLFVSHYSERKGPARLRWWLAGVDDEGRTIASEPKERPARWEPYGVRVQEPLRVEVPRVPFVGAVALALHAEGDERIAANFVNVVVRPKEPPPRVERRGDREAVIRFAPEDFARGSWSGGSNPLSEGKVYGRGRGFLEYRLKLPEAVARAAPEAIELRLEAAAKGGAEQVDFAEGHLNPRDYPQTDARRHPSTLEVAVNGQAVARRALADDPADARGVLSHLKGVDHGSYGYLIRLPIDLPGSARADLAAGRPLVLRLAVPDDAEPAGGLCVFGAETGRYPFDPTVVIRTRDALPPDLGVKPGETVALAIDPRTSWLLAAGDSNRGRSASWAYTTADPGAGWARPGFDDRGWRRGAPGFGRAGTKGLSMRTPWEADAIWLRTTVDVPALRRGDALVLRLFHDEDVEVLVNDRRLYRARGFVTEPLNIPLDDDQKALFRPGENVIAVTCRQVSGGQGVDVGLKLIRGE